MSANLDSLYQDIILDHNNRPRNQRALPGANARGRGFNPACGDEVEVYLRIEGGCILEASFQGQGCAISQASASMLTLAVKDLSLPAAHNLILEVDSLLRIPDFTLTFQSTKDLNALAGVRRFPARQRCASLAWNALAKALEQFQNSSSKTN